MAPAEQISSRFGQSEDDFGRKWDKCLSDSIVKMGGGLALGVVFSVVLFKRRAWPITFGLGTGLGMGYANCQHEFNRSFLVPANKIRIKPQESAQGH